MFPDALDESGQVDIWIFCPGRILCNELYHIEVGVFVFEAQVPEKCLNQDLIHGLISVN